MRRLLWIIVVMLVAPYTSQAATLQDLIDDFRVLTAEPNSDASFYTDADATVYINYGQRKIVELGNYLEKSQDITFSFDSTTYSLPSDFQSLANPGAVVLKDGEWYTVTNNPSFAVDTTAFQFFIAKRHPDTAKLYLKGSAWDTGDVLTLFYRGYASVLVSTTDTCEVPEGRHASLLDEAMRYYQQSSKHHDVAASMFQQNRIDMGFKLEQ